MEGCIQRGVSGIALVRAADAMLRSLGGAEIRLVFPQMSMPDDFTAQLGLVDPGVEEVRIAPVVTRYLPTTNQGPRRRLEFLLPASEVMQRMSERNSASWEEFFNSALGVIHDGELFRVEGVTVEHFGGMAYLYRATGIC